MNHLIPMQIISNATLALGMDFENSFLDFSHPSRSFSNYGVSFETSPVINGSYSIYNPPEPDGGDTQLLITADSPELRLIGDFTVEFWHYNVGVGSTLYDGGFQTILGKGEPSSSGTNSESIGIYNSYPFLNSANGAAVSASTVMESTETVPTNAWTHHCWSRKSDVLKLFLNGILVNQTSWSGTWGNDDQPLTIGGVQDSRLGTGSGYLSMGGYLDRLRIWQGCKYFTNFTPLTTLN